MQTCYCHSGLDYQQCCQRYHQGELAPTPAALMRSRYSAFVLGLSEYLYQTHHPEYRQGLTVEQLSQQDVEWIKLKIIFQAISPDERFGIVEFKAWYQNMNTRLCLHERSEFIKQGQRWFYTTGQMNPQAIGRNDPCPCKSGKKFKQCCLNRKTN